MNTDDRSHAAGLLAAIYGTHWLMLPEELAALAELAIQTNIGEIVALMKRSAGQQRTASVPMSAEGGVVTIPVYGPIVPRETWFSRFLGLTSAEEIAAAHSAALRDPNVRGIVFDVDSPGGAASGIDALAGLIFAARGVKPTRAYIEGSGASAAYWIASAADEIVVSPAAIVGSIGVVASFERDSGRTIQIVSSQSPNKRPDLESDAGRAVVQTVVDSLADVFIKAVAAHRRISPSAVIERFGRGSVRVGQEAVAAGMADRVGTIESVIGSIRGNATPGPQLAASPYGVVATRGVGPEHAAMIASPGPSDDALRARWNAEPALHGRYFKFELFAAFERSIAEGTRTRAEVDDLVGNPVSHRSLSPSAPTPPAKPMSFEEQLRARWLSDRNLRAEFRRFETFAAYEHAVVAGRHIGQSAMEEKR